MCVYVGEDVQVYTGLGVLVSFCECQRVRMNVSVSVHGSGA